MIVKKTFPLLAIIIFATVFVVSSTDASPDTFGKINVGSFDVNMGDSGLYACKFTAPSYGDVTKLVAYLKWTGGTVKAAVYSDNNGEPYQLLGSSGEVFVSDEKWYDFTLSCSIQAGVPYWLTIFARSGTWGRRDAGSSKQFAVRELTYGNFPNSFGSIGQWYAWEMSIYAEYTPSIPGPDTKAPTYSDIGTNSTVVGSACSFHARWSDDFGLSGFIFGTNITGTWQNDTWTDPWTGTPMLGLSEVIKILNGGTGIRVGYRFWCNDTSNNWADTETHTLTTTYNHVRAVVIHSDYSYMLPGDYIDFPDAVVFGVLQGAGIPYDTRPANEMANVERLKQYSLVVFPQYLADRLPNNLTNAVLTACTEGVGVWAVETAGATDENGQERQPMFVSQINNVIPSAYETMTPWLAANDTYLTDEFYNTGELLSGPVGPSLPVPRMRVYDTSRPYHEVASVFSGSRYRGAGVVTGTLGRGRTVWCIGAQVVWQVHGILTRLVRWAAQSQVFLELADSPSGASLQIRVDGDILDQYPQAFQEFIWKIGNITDARMSLYFVSQVTSADEYLLARQHPKNEYGSHSKTHADLPTLSTTALRDEMNGSKTDIEANLGWEITGFAYPYNSFSKSTTAAAGAYEYVGIGMPNNMSCVYPNRVYIQRAPDAKTTALNTYSVFMTSMDDYGLFVDQRKDAATVLQVWKNHFDFHVRQAAVSESNDIMVLLWHVKEMGEYGTGAYFNFLDWVVNTGGQFVTAQQLVQSVKELETVDLEYVKSGNFINVTLVGSLSQGHPLRLFNSSDNIQSVTIDGEVWTNYRDKEAVLPYLGPGEHKIELMVGLVPTATIRGVVTDFETGNPIESVNITCAGTHTLTASDGTYSFTVTLGSYVLSFEKSGYYTSTTTVDCPTMNTYTVNVSLVRVLVGDINSDGTINNDDVILLNQAWGSTTTNSNWNPNADLNKDNMITILDLLLLGKNYGRTA